MSMRRGLAIGTLILFAATSTTNGWGWGPEGHRMIAQLAVETLPPDTPKFLTAEKERLMFLSFEPDMWRDAEEQKSSPALRIGHDPDHRFHLELFHPPQLPADRYSFLGELCREGKDPREVGILPYRAMELFQRMRVSFRQWRAATDPATRRFLEARIIDDAGILGHYIADASEPLHTTVNTNGWVLPQNSKGYTRDTAVHIRFEADFVRAHIHDSDVRPLVRQLHTVDNALPCIYAEIERSHDQVIPLYELDKAEPFGTGNTDPKAEAFVAARLADAASTLRDLWYTAYRTSEDAQ